MDSRFFRIFGPVPVADLLRAADIDPTPPDLVGDPARPISGAAPSGAAGPDDLAFSEKTLADCGAGLLLAPAGSSGEGCVAATANPRLAFALAAPLLASPRWFDPADDWIADSAQIEEGVTLLPGVVIGRDARIGAGAVIGPGTVIGPGVCIGRGSEIGANVCIGFALIGDGVVIQANTSIGETGFGLVPGPKGLVNLPHFGRVVIQEEVAIGANCCVARGMFGDTQIGPGARIDSLCLIAHNCVIGANALIAGACGLSGSVTIGDGAMLGGGVGIADHVSIGAGAKLGARSGVRRDVPAGAKWGGMPARPMKQFAYETAWVALNARRRAKRGRPDRAGTKPK